MSILITGCTNLIENVSVKNLVNRESVVITANERQKHIASGRKVMTVDINDISWHKLFEVQDFRYVIYLSDYLNPLNDDPEEAVRLYEILSCARQFHVDRIFICLPQTETETESPARAKGVRELEQLADLFTQNEEIFVKKLYVPYIMNPADPDNFVGKLRNSESVFKDLPWKSGKEIGFTEIKPFLQFMRQALADESADAAELTMSAGSSEIVDKTMLKDPFFAPYGNTAGERRKKAENFLAKEKKERPVLSFLVSILIVVGGSLLVEWAVRFFGELSVFRYVDLRLLYIIVIALLGDTFLGGLAGVLEAALLLISRVGNGYTWYMVLYNPDNWVYYLIMILTGAGIGYLMANNQLEVSLAEKERDYQKEQNRKMRSFYRQLMDKKNEYREDLQNSRTGFGKLYEAFTRLSSVDPSHIMAESIPVIEDLLSNHTVSIYSVYENNPNSARLQVASRQVYDEKPRSVMLDTHAQLAETLRRDNIWFNQELLEGEPMYAAPIADQGRLIAFIQVDHADFNQTSLYYQNLLFVISRLIGGLIINALSYQKEI